MCLWFYNTIFIAQIMLISIFHLIIQERIKIVLSSAVCFLTRERNYFFNKTGSLETMNKVRQLTSESCYMTPLSHSVLKVKIFFFFKKIIKRKTTISALCVEFICTLKPQYHILKVYKISIKVFVSPLIFFLFLQCKTPPMGLKSQHLITACV